MQIEELCTLLKAVAETGVQSFIYEENGVKVSVQGREPGAYSQPVPAVTTPAPVAATPEQAAGQEGKCIVSPLVGVFYAAPSEDAEPFVKVGDTVKAGQTIAIVEAMKLMNEIEAEEDGIITEILVKNADAVQFGQPLFRILEV